MDLSGDAINQVRIRGGFYVLPERLLIRVTGNDRLRYLNGQLTNDLKRLVLGEAMQACLLTPKGKLSAVLWVTLEQESILLEAPLELSEELLARLERYLVADDVMLEIVSSEPTIHIFGALMKESFFEKVPGIFISRLNLSGKDIKISALPADFLKQHQALTEHQVEILRIEQGIPQWGNELTPDRLPPEAHLERQAIDYNKGCYVGQEVISRLRSLGHVNRILVSLVSVNKGEELIVGMKLALHEDPKKMIGFITSVVQQSDSQKFIALGYVMRDYAVCKNQFFAIDEATNKICNVIIRE